MADNKEINGDILYTALKHAHTDSVISGMALSVAYGHDPAITYVSGKDVKGNDLVEDSLFPVASITKLAVALAILRLGDQGLLSVDDMLEKYLPQAASALPGVTLTRLMTHSAGLPDLPEHTWVWDEHLTWSSMAKVCLTVKPILPPGEKVWYVSTGYGYLGLIIEHITGLPLAQAMPELVFRPLGIEAYQGVEPPRQTVFIKDPGDMHAGTPFEIWNTAFWRSWGEPWGGLVTTPAGTLALLRAYLGIPKDFLRTETVATASHDQTGGLGGGFPWQEFNLCPWGLGPMIFTAGMHHWGYPDAPAGTIGHVGYSGCAVYALPEREISWSIHSTLTCADPSWEMAFGEINAAILSSI